MAGEFLYFTIYLAQQLGVMLGVGAQTVLLCTHLIAVHHSERESQHASYARAARFALGVGLILIVASGLAAIAVHILNAQLSIVLAPAFLFKWLLILLLVVAFFVQKKFVAWENTYFAVVGGTWYALFLVHSLGPVTTWSTLLVLYIVWSVFFALVWACFMAVMSWTSDVKVLQNIKKSPPKYIHPAPLPPPPPLPLPFKLAAPVLAPVLVPVLLPEVKPKTTLIQDIIDHILVPALRIMPQKIEDIGKQNRPPVVKLKKE